MEDVRGLGKKAALKPKRQERTRDAMADAIRNSGKATEKQAAATRRFMRVCGTVMYVVAAGWAVVAIACMSSGVSLGWICLIPGLICFFIGHSWLKATKE